MVCVCVCVWMSVFLHLYRPRFLLHTSNLDVIKMMHIHGMSVYNMWMLLQQRQPTILISNIILNMREREFMRLEWLGIFGLFEENIVACVWVLC